MKRDDRASVFVAAFSLVGVGVGIMTFSADEAGSSVSDVVSRGVGVAAAAVGTGPAGLNSVAVASKTVSIVQLVGVRSVSEERE